MPSSAFNLPHPVKLIREKHGEASKATRQAAEALAEADLKAQAARGACFEWMAAKLNPDAEFLELRENAFHQATHYSTLLDEFRTAQTLEMRTLHTELEHLEVSINAIQAKLGLDLT